MSLHFDVSKDQVADKSVWYQTTKQQKNFVTVLVCKPIVDDISWLQHLVKSPNFAQNLIPIIQATIICTT